MPYSVVKSGKHYLLKLKSSGKTLGRHKSEKSAHRQRAAIEINKKKGKMV